MKGCLATIAAILILSGLDTSHGEELVNGKMKPSVGQLKKIQKVVMRERNLETRLGSLMLRLAFHQCVGKSCDACVDPTDPENKGFEKTIHHLNNIHQHPDVFPYMTKSDLIAYSLIPIMGFMILQNNLECLQCRNCSTPTPNWEYWWGRPDGCENVYTKIEGSTPNGFPTVQMSRQDMFEWYKKDFNFTPAEAMVLAAGGHSTGIAHKNVSGFSGDFLKPNQYGRAFNNRVLRWLITDDVELRYVANEPDATDDKFFQVDGYGPSGGRKGMLLDSDIISVYDIKRDPLEDLQCKINDKIFDVKGQEPREPYPYPYCTKSELYDLAHEYVYNPVKFTNDFFDIFTRMFNKGNEGKLQKLELYIAGNRFLKVKTMDDFRYISKKGGRLCYKNADKEWAEALRKAIADKKESVETSLESASSKIEEAKNAKGDGNNEDADAALAEAETASDKARKLLAEATKTMEEAIDLALRKPDGKKVPKTDIAAGKEKGIEAKEGATKATVEADKAVEQAEIALDALA